MVVWLMRPSTAAFLWQDVGVSRGDFCLNAQQPNLKGHCHVSLLQSLPAQQAVSANEWPNSCSIEAYMYEEQIKAIRAQELCESRGGRPGLLSLINLRFLWT